MRRRYYKNWCTSKKKAFTKYSKKFESEDGKKEIQVQLEKMKQCSVIRVLAHTRIRKVKGLKQKKAHVIEIQVNGGNVAQKVDFAYGLFEKQVPIDAIFQKDKMIDIIGVTKGKGYGGVVTRWDVTRLPRKTHCGLRKVACIGAWHPARAGICFLLNAFWLYRTEKDITSVGGFPYYGVVKEDYLLIKGCCVPNKH